MNPGRIRRVNGPLVQAELADDVVMNDLVLLGTNRIPGEVVAISGSTVTVQAYEYTGALCPGAPVQPTGAPLSARLGPGLLGNVFDGLLRPLSYAPPFLVAGATAEQDRGPAARWQFTPVARAQSKVGPGAVLGLIEDLKSLEYRVLVPSNLSGVVDYIAAPGRYDEETVIATVEGVPVRMVSLWPVRRPRPHSGNLRKFEPLTTGTRVVDLLFPLARGGSAAVPGGFGTGKTILLQQIAKWSDADVIIYVGCGERGNEMSEVVGDLMALEDPRTGGRLSERTVIIANTSNMPMMARETSIYTGVTVAEYFRDMGHDAVVIADSTSRWAEARREFASRSGALPAEEGYPADLASALAAFYERAGVVQIGEGSTGSVTIIGAVSPPGGDLTEPVTAYTERFVRARWTLDAELAYARHYPAVSWSGSFSHDADELFQRAESSGAAALRARIVALLAEADRIAVLADLVGVTALPGAERIALLGSRLIRAGVLQQSALSDNDGYSTPAKTAALAEGSLAIHAACKDAIDRGVAADTIEEFDFAEFLRAREETGPDGADEIRARYGKLVDQLREVQP